jgi:hypothetical protein
MFRAWSIAMESRKVRGLLLLVGVLATVAFGPLSVFGAYLLVMAVLSDAPDRFHFIGWSIVGAGGVIGMAGAWVRLLVPGVHFQSRPLLKWLTVAALAAGVLVAALTFAGVLRNPANLMAWLMVPALVVGVFLLGATIGEVRSNSTIERDGPQAARPSL